MLGQVCGLSNQLLSNRRFMLWVGNSYASSIDRVLYDGETTVKPTDQIVLKSDSIWEFDIVRTEKVAEFS